MLPIYKALGVTLVSMIVLAVIRLCEFNTTLFSFQLLLLISILIATIIIAIYVTYSITVILTVNKPGKRKWRKVNR